MNTTEDDIWNMEYPLGFRVTMATILLLEETGGLICNVIVLIVFHLHHKTSFTKQGITGSRTQSQKDSNPFITNMTVADLLMCCTALPLTLVLLLDSRSQRVEFCFFHEASISFSSCTSALSLLVISFDRYETILTPFKTQSAVQRKWKVLGIIWTISLLGFCSPFFTLVVSDTNPFTSQLPEIGNNSEHLPCFMWVETSEKRVYFELYYVFLYLISNVVMIVCYVKIYKLAKRRINVRMTLVTVSMINVPLDNNKGAGGAGAPEPLHKMHDRTLTKMTLTIVSTFMICWGPHACTSIAIMINGSTMVLEETQLCCLALAYSTTILHPLIYTFMRRTFRRNLVQRLQKRISKKNLNQVHPEPDPSPEQPPIIPMPSICGTVNNQITVQATHLNKTSFKDSGLDGM